MHKRLLPILFIFITLATQAQKINTAYTYRDLTQTRYIRYTYENDFFTATDELYTQGINLEYASPAQKNFITSRLLIAPKNYRTHYKLGIQHNAYTPQSIQDPSIRRTDQPYAAALLLQFTNTATHPTRKLHIASTLTAGVTGKIAGGEWMQKTIHRNLNNVMPRGWDYQIANDIALNYRIQIENNLLSLSNIFTLNTTASADVGTLLTQLSAGGNITLGLFNNPFHNTDGTQNTSIRLYMHPQIHAIGYDATLQGGLLSKSPHTFTPSQIERIVYTHRYGIALQIHKIYLEYYYQYQTKNFTTGTPHNWGGITIGVGL